MGFYNIYTEGQQAEEYKARKAKEAEEKEKAEAERRARRYQDENSMKPDRWFYNYRQAGDQARHYNPSDAIDVGFGKKKLEELEQDRSSLIYSTPDGKKNDADKKRKSDTETVLNRDRDRRNSEADSRGQEYDNARSNASQAYDDYRSHGIFRNLTKSGKAAKKDLEEAEKKVADAKAAYDRAYKAKYSYAADDADAINRHMRRHPDQWDGDKRIKTRSESGIFESVEFLND